MHRVERDDAVGQGKLGKQLLRRRYLVGFLVDLDVRQHQQAIDRKSIQDLPRLDIMEGVEAPAQRLAVDANGPRGAAPAALIQRVRMLAKNLFDGRRIKPAQDIPDVRAARSSFPRQPESLFQFAPMRFDEGVDRLVAVRAANDGEYRKQQDMRKLIHLAFGAAGIRNLGKQRQKTFERLHGNLRQQVILP